VLSTPKALSLASTAATTAGSNDSSDLGFFILCIISNYSRRRIRLHLRRPTAVVTPLVATARAQVRALAEQGVTLLALPPYYASGLPPDAAELLHRPLCVCLVLALRLCVPGVTGGPFVALGGLAGAFRAPDVTARLAGSCCGGGEEGVALVAGATDALGGGLVGKLLAIAGGYGQELLLPGLLGVLLGCALLALLARRLLLGVLGALLAAPVLALHTHLVVAVKGAAQVAASVHTHADGLLDTGDQRASGRGDDELVRLEGQAVLGEEGAGTLALHGIAVEDCGRLGGCRDGNVDAGGGGEGEVGGSRAVMFILVWEDRMLKRTSTYAATELLDLLSVSSSCLVDSAWAGSCTTA
jgi:hypothetical protein